MPEATAIRPITAEAAKPEGSPAKPFEKPKPPLGQAEEQIADEIQTVATQPSGNPDQTLRNIAATPKFIREFSKEHSQEERQKTARDIRETRGEHFRQKQEVAEQQAQVQEEVSKKESTLTEQRQRLEALRDEVARLSGPWFGRLLHYTRLRGLNADLQTAEEAYQELQQEEPTLQIQKQAAGTEADKLKDAPKLEEGRQKIQDFYRKEKEKWASADYTKEDIARYFTEEHLASLSMEEYVLLLRRFPSEMVTHVTRQGIRDHTGHSEHTAGVGEYSDSFRQILQDGRVRSNFGALFRNGLTKEAVAQALELGKSIRTRKDAKTMLAKFVSQGPGTGSYADRTALHVAAQEVADNFYGGERGNEIFFAFPSAHIAAEHVFGGLGVRFVPDNLTNQHNDNWIWSKDHAGVTINAGVVFIPADARVNPETGSKYELTTDRKPVERQDRINAVAGFLQSANLEEITHAIETVISNPSVQEIESLQMILANEFSITDPQVQSALLNYSSTSRIKNDKAVADSLHEDFNPLKTARTILLQSGLLYKVPEITIPSRQFWENYFTQHTEQQPKRIVYYEGGNPTKALRVWRETNDIAKKAQTTDLGFPEKQILPFTISYDAFGQATAPDDPRQTVGMDRFKSVAEEVIDEYFAPKSRRKIAA